MEAFKYDLGVVFGRKLFSLGIPLERCAKWPSTDPTFLDGAVDGWESEEMSNVMRFYI